MAHMHVSLAPEPIYLRFGIANRVERETVKLRHLISGGWVSTAADNFTDNRAVRMSCS